jgi:hypothetical protein
VEINGLNNYELKIINILGQTVLTHYSNSEKTSINLNDLKAGLYFIELQQPLGKLGNEVNMPSKKIVIER